MDVEKSEAPLPLLSIRGVAKTFGAVTALRSADLEILPGEVHALMGANGAGKSTLVKIITGVFPADSGEMTLGGKSALFRSPAEARKSGIVSVYQDPAIVPDLTVAQNMRLARVPIDAVRSAMRDLGIAHVDLGMLARHVDFAYLRLIDLARALASNPRILMLDEITAALPADLSERVFEVMRDWRKRGSSVIFISHRMAEVTTLCDRATVLRDGVTVGVIPDTRHAEEKIVNLMLGAEVARAASEVRRLSGGNMQKVVIARWIAAGFKTLLCFDPTRGIDIGTKRQIYALLREVAEQGASVLLFTSELPEIRLACDRAIVLFGGRISGEMAAAEATEARLMRAAHGLPAEEEAAA